MQTNNGYRCVTLGVAERLAEKRPTVGSIVRRFAFVAKLQTAAIATVSAPRAVRSL